MKPFFILIFLITILSCVFISYADDSTENCVYFFYGNGCSHCAKVEPKIEELEQSVEVHTFEIYDNRSNMILLNNLFDKYGIQNNERGIPVVFAGNSYFIGDDEILNNLDFYLENNNPKCINITSINDNSNLNSLSLFTIISAALVDSINPCAIAVLLILLGGLVISKNKKRALAAGLLFTLSIYISYFLFGIGLFSAIKVSGLSYWFYKTIGILAIIIGILNIKDFFWYGGGGFVMEIPISWRPKLKSMLSNVTSPIGAFIIGFVVCLFELPCTGGPYIVILGLLAEKMTLLSSIPLLLIYNIFFVLPLLVITFGIYFGFTKTESAAKWKDNNIRILHLIAGIIMLFLGALIVFGFI